MKKEEALIDMEESNVIRVDFRKDRPAIDFDPYFNGVKEIHCRLCGRRRSRKGAIEVPKSWGYFCKDCKTSIQLPGSIELQNKENASFIPLFCPAGNES